MRLGGTSGGGGGQGCSSAQGPQLFKGVRLKNGLEKVSRSLRPRVQSHGLGQAGVSTWGAVSAIGEGFKGSSFEVPRVQAIIWYTAGAWGRWEGRNPFPAKEIGLSLYKLM